MYSSVIKFWKNIEKIFNVFSMLHWFWEKSRAIVLKLVNPSLCFTFTLFCPINCTLKILSLSFPLMYQNSSKNWAKRVRIFPIYFFLTPKHILTFKERRIAWVLDISVFWTSPDLSVTGQMAQTSNEYPAVCAVIIHWTYINKGRNKSKYSA